MNSLLKAINVTKKFAGLTAVNSMNLEVNEGEIVGLIGPNGAGKTTFFNAITGFYPATSGEVRFLGKDITSKSTHENCKSGMARTFQIVQPFGNLTALENVMVGAFNRTDNYQKAMEISEELLDFVGLADKRDVIVADMTIGDQRKLEMARALATRPKLVLLDEVMAGLTPTEINGVIQLARKIRNSGVAILMIEHIMAALMQLSDRVVVMDQGEKIAEGAPVEIRTNKRVIESYLGSAYQNA